MYHVLSFWDRVCIDIHDTRRFRLSCSELWGTVRMYILHACIYSLCKSAWQAALSARQETPTHCDVCQYNCLISRRTSCIWIVALHHALSTVISRDKHFSFSSPRHQTRKRHRFKYTFVLIIQYVRVCMYSLFIRRASQESSFDCETGDANPPAR